MPLTVAARRLTPLALGLFRKTGKSLHTTSRRTGGPVLYREQMFEYKEPKLNYYVGWTLSVTFWYFILYHFYYEFDHVVPKESYPDPSKFTDEELGIPPDDEE